MYAFVAGLPITIYQLITIVQIIWRLLKSFYNFWYCGIGGVNTLKAGQNHYFS